RAICGVAVIGLLLPRLGARADDSFADHLHRLVERELLPGVAVGAPILDLVLAQRALDVALRGLPLRTEAAPRDRACGIALDVRDLPVLDMDELAAADGAVRTDRLHHVVGLLDPRLHRPRLLGPGGLAEAERITLPELPNQRPPSEGFAEFHGGTCYLPAHV